MNDLQKKVDFSFIRYANCWEDADVLIDALRPSSSDSILCIASAGDNALALLGAGAGSVHAIDISQPQLFLTELKQQAFLSLEYSEMLIFLGVIKSDSSQRLKYYGKFKKGLSSSAKAFWDSNKNLLSRGVINTGKFESYFSVFRNWFLPAVHNKRTVRHLLESKTDEQQKQFYDRKWNTWRWRLLMRFFFGKYSLGKYGRDPEFLKHVEIPVAEYIKQKTARHLKSSAATNNYFLNHIFHGEFANSLPFYLREKNFIPIKANAGRLTISGLSADEALRSGSYQSHCFSNIFEYMSVNDFSNLASSWNQLITSGSKLAYWNLMLSRRFSESNPSAFRFCNIAKRISEQDKGFFYRDFILDEKI